MDLNDFLFTFQVNLCSTMFATLRMKGPRSKWTIYKQESDKYKACLSVGILKAEV